MEEWSNCQSSSIGVLRIEPSTAPVLQDIRCPWRFHFHSMAHADSMDEDEIEVVDIMNGTRA